MPGPRGPLCPPPNLLHPSFPPPPPKPASPLSVVTGMRRTEAPNESSDQISRRKKQPKDRVSGRDIPGTSGTQTSGYPGQNFMQVVFFCCFKQGVAGMSRDLGQDVPDLDKLYARELWVDFS